MPDMDTLMSMTDNLINGHQRATQIPGYSVGLSPRHWENLLRFRQRLSSIRELAQSLTKGSLLGSNTPFSRYRDQLTNFESETLPDNYELQQEMNLLQSTHSTVIERARTIQKQYSEDWLGGWGGRISGRDVLTPWETFLSRLVRGLDNERARSRAQSLLNEARSQLSEWSP